MAVLQLVDYNRKMNRHLLRMKKKPEVGTAKEVFDIFDKVLNVHRPIHLVPLLTDNDSNIF